MVELKGKGIYIWIIRDDEDPQDTARACKDAGLSHATIKVADAGYAYNVSYDQGQAHDKVPALVQALHAVGIQAWGWQFVYGNTPEAEASIAIKRTLELGLDGFIVNAEGAYKNKHACADFYMNRLRKSLSSYPIALSSYRFPSFHREFPWKEFLSQVDINMPQVYWMLSTNAGDQMARCYAEFQQPQYPQVPIFPTGAAFSEYGWRAKPGEVLEFMQTAKGLGVEGCNFWLYNHACKRFSDLWEVISSFDWQGTGYEEPDPPDEDDFLFYGMCKANYLRIRKGPGTGYEIVGYLENGDIEPIYGVENGWYRIDRGYVSGSWMTKISTPPTIEPTVEQRLDRIEADLDKLLAIHPEINDA